MRVKIFVEGGGPSASARTAAACRKGFRQFFEKVLVDGHNPHIVASGSRDQAHEDFRRSLKTDPEVFAILLVDSEDPVSRGKTASEHLREREKNWNPIPRGQAHLMVQCMEAWFLADKNALSAYYGTEFKAQALRQNPNIEGIVKKDVLGSLEAATKEAKSKGKYHKTKHGFDILGNIDPNKVANASPFAKDLINVLRERLAQ